MDLETGNSYEHRRGWIEDRLQVLSSIFAVELCAYAVMSNHYHLVVKLIPDEAQGWSDDQVFERWLSLFKGPLLVQRYCAGASLTTPESDTLRSIARVYRSRLKSLSWFMKCLNEPIARRANVEDGCTGHFWEARFQSQALKTDRALLAAMVYVDLNPVRAGIAVTPEDSEFTSLRARLSGNSPALIRGAARRLLRNQELKGFCLTPRLLSAFSEDGRANNDSGGVPISREDYLELVDATGRVVTLGKRGRIDTRLAPILDRLGLSTSEWSKVSTEFRRHYRNGDLRKISQS